MLPQFRRLTAALFVDDSTMKILIIHSLRVMVAAVVPNPRQRVGAHCEFTQSVLGSNIYMAFEQQQRQEKVSHLLLLRLRLRDVLMIIYLLLYVLQQLQRQLRLL
jgi:uncharacterized membrane protein